MAQQLIVSDASPLIGLSIVGGINWLSQLFNEVWIPQQVFREVVTGKHARGEIEIQSAINAGWLKVWQKQVPLLDGIDLDEGESACISLALQMDIPALLIMDERSGRAVAKEKGIPVAGTAAIIGMAKTQGIIPSAKDVFETLHSSDFRISAAVIKEVLKHVNEN